MEPRPDYFQLPARGNTQGAGWDHQWSNSAFGWEMSRPIDLPLLQYTTAALGYPPGMSYTPLESPHSNYTASLPSITNSPTNAAFPSDASSAQLEPIIPVYDGRYTPSNYPLQTADHAGNCDDEEMGKVDPDDYSWSPSSRKCDPVPELTSRPTHRRSKSTNEVSMSNARKAHTVVERNYRDRLNDKISELGLYLFETPADSRTKPSKSLIMTRAKERLQQLEARNDVLEREVVKLKQHIAILDHIVGGQGGVGIAGE
ncbi:hypothetical protein F5882DRAFT_520078 [Hyaloscypha sp. PMI_1271]|nr:hypothetical protein F5882DRAFT_520078 [Hyaloscypha sp. PMI_1271]